MTASGTVYRFSTALFFATLIGCGGADGPTTYQVSGTVTYDGTPLPSGSVQFEPDSAAGNTGPGTVAAITDGTYQTPPGAGVVGGPHIVRINPPPLESGADMSTVIVFPAYETRVDLPQQATVQDFDVPAAPRS